MGTFRLAAGTAVMLAALIAACSDEAPGREVAIVAERDACTPASISATPGERLTLQITNRSNGDRTVEGIGGTALEKVEVASGQTRSASFTMPESGSARLECSPGGGGASTLIEIAPRATP